MCSLGFSKSKVGFAIIQSVGLGEMKIFQGPFSPFFQTFHDNAPEAKRHSKRTRKFTKLAPLFTKLNFQ